MKPFYVYQLSLNRHTREDPVHGTSDCLDKAFLSPGLSSRDISFCIADDHMGSDHFPIQIHLTSHSNKIHHLQNHATRFDKTDNDLLHNTLKVSLNSIDTDITTQDKLEELAVTLCDKLMKAVNTSTPKTIHPKRPQITY